MTDPIETAVKTDVESEFETIKGRLVALEAKAAGYIHAHIVWLLCAVCLAVGSVGGYLAHK